MSLNSVPFWRCCKECDRRRAGGRVWGLSKWRRGKLKREARKEIDEYAIIEWKNYIEQDEVEGN